MDVDREVSWGLNLMEEKEKEEAEGQPGPTP